MVIPSRIVLQPNSSSLFCDDISRSFACSLQYEVPTPGNPSSVTHEMGDRLEIPHELGRLAIACAAVPRAKKSISQQHG